MGISSYRNSLRSLLLDVFENIAKCFCLVCRTVGEMNNYPNALLMQSATTHRKRFT